MADYSKRTVRNEYVEFALPNPTTAGELGKAFNAAQHELSEDGMVADDSITVHATEEEIVLRCKAKQEVNTRTVKVTWSDDAVDDALARLESIRDGDGSVLLYPSDQALQVAIDALRATVGSS